MAASCRHTAYSLLPQDRNPDNQSAASENFKQISQAYEVLSDPKKKQIYDQYGEEGLQAEAQGGSAQGGYRYRRAEDIFSEVASCWTVTVTGSALPRLPPTTGLVAQQPVSCHAKHQPGTLSHSNLWASMG